MKRQDALRKTRTICERLSGIDLETFPIWPVKLYLFGSVLTNKPDPEDIDLALVYEENPKIEYSDAEISQMIFYEPRLQPQNKASVELRRGLRKVQLYMVPRAIEQWDYLPFFQNGEGLRLIWKPNIEWSSIVNDVEINPTVWQGPRSKEFEQSTVDDWKALAEEEKQRRKAKILGALELDEEDLAQSG
jgi:hypothetical protein